MPSTRLQLVALRTVKYNDHTSMLSAYSLQAGRLSFAVPAGGTREAARRRALLMPLSLVECSANLRKSSGALTMTDVRAALPLHGIYSNPVKMSIAIFIADALCAALKESQADPEMFAFVAETAKALNDLPASRILNFHVAFLAQLARHLGIEPDYSTYAPGSVLCYDDGIFRATPPVSSRARWLAPEESAFAAQLGRITYANQHLYPLTRATRAYVTDQILAYFSIHHTPMTSLASLQVLREM